MHKIFTLSRPVGASYIVVSAGTASDLLKYIANSKDVGFISYEYTVYTWEDGDTLEEYVSDSLEDVESYLQQFLPIPC